DTTFKKPSIRFKGNHGVISLPVRKSSDSLNGERVFNFSMTPVNERGSYECVQQCKNRNGAPHLEQQGTVQKKLQILATDEVYQATKDKMTLAEEEMRKSTTKVIDKVTGRNIGHKVKVKKSQYPHSSSKHALVSRSNGSKTLPAKKMTSTKPPGGGTHIIPKIHKASYRDNIIHLLALKPYKKPELILRLQRLGVNQKDRSQLGTILQQVATMKDNTFTLNKHVYNEVREDWFTYSDDDRRVLRSKLAQIRNGNEYSPTQNGHSLSPSSTTATSPSSPQKRPAEPDNSMDPKSKRQRIAHTARPTPALNNNNNVNGGAITNNTLLNIKSDAITSTRLSPTLDKVTTSNSDSKRRDLQEKNNRIIKGSGDKKHRDGNELKTSPNRLKKASSKISPDRGKTKSSADIVRETTKATSPVNKKGQHNGTSQVASSTSSIPEYMMKYITIKSREQRQKYKDDFNAEYDQYRKLHNKVDRITKKFIELQNLMEQTAEHSDNYESIKTKVIEEYQLIKKEHPDFQEEKKDCQTIHLKLAHIKKLIVEYDQSQLKETSTTT
uniref:RNA polymerase II elongation factor ELL2-like n=1 Tax=Saccoglossus kowalevskii TaxID=10224 RepID=A0ABM0LTX8_SACKO